MPLPRPRDIERLELCLRDLYAWLTTNKLKLNSSKTELLQITPLNKPPVDLSLTVNGNKHREKSRESDLASCRNTCQCLCDFGHGLCKQHQLGDPISAHKQPTETTEHGSSYYLSL